MAWLERRVCKVQTAQTILNVIQQRGQRNLPLSNGTYRLLYNQNLYLRAYANLYSNQGSLTPGITGETADGMSLEKINNISEALRSERYRWTSVRRTYIPKSNGKQRALGIPEWKDKVIQEVLRSILEAYYEPQFSDSSHGFRPYHSPSTALTIVQKRWKGTKWWIEGDLESYFDTIDHDILLDILGRNIQDQRLLKLLRGFLKAGYMENWQWIRNLTGVPQGGVLSPLLSNIYLNELDVHVEAVLIPQYTRGKKRRRNPVYEQVAQTRRNLRSKKDYSQDKELTAEMRRLPSYDPLDPDFRRLRYIRYADDFLLSFIGSKREAVQIKDDLTKWISDNLNLKLNQDKTLITHAGSQPARFLGYDIQTQHANDKIDHRGRRCINGAIGLRVPKATIHNYVREYMKGNKIVHVPMLIPESDYAILNWYQDRLRGIVQYYALAWNVSHLRQLVNAMQLSLLKTLAAKHQSTVVKMWLEYRSVVDNGTGRAARCLIAVVPRDNDRKPLVARFGGIPLRRNRNAEIRDLTLRNYTEKRTELIERLLAEVCEMCEITDVPLEIHHVHALKDLNQKGRTKKTPWEVKMSAMRRKTLAVCRPCHAAITHGKFNKPRQLK